MKIIYSITVLLTLVSCSSGNHPQPNIEIIQDMMEGPGVKAQEGDPTSPTLTSMRVPPEGTVPVGFIPYPFKGKADLAVNNKNPLAVSESSLARGKHLYNIYCIVCHGATGKGDGTVASKMSVKPPPLVSDKIKKWSDGSIYHVITDGQGVMGTYATQITDSKDRWAIVNYVRGLQKSN